VHGSADPEATAHSTFIQSYVSSKVYRPAGPEASAHCTPLYHSGHQPDINDCIVQVICDRYLTSMIASFRSSI